MLLLLIGAMSTLLKRNKAGLRRACFRSAMVRKDEYGEHLGFYLQSEQDTLVAISTNVDEPFLNITISQWHEAFFDAVIFGEMLKTMVTAAGDTRPIRVVFEKQKIHRAMVETLCQLEFVFPCLGVQQAEMENDEIVEIVTAYKVPEDINPQTLKKY